MSPAGPGVYVRVAPNMFVLDHRGWVHVHPGVIVERTPYRARPIFIDI